MKFRWWYRVDGSFDGPLRRSFLDRYIVNNVSRGLSLSLLRRKKEGRELYRRERQLPCPYVLVCAAAGGCVCIYIYITADQVLGLKRRARRRSERERELGNEVTDVLDISLSFVHPSHALLIFDRLLLALLPSSPFFSSLVWLLAVVRRRRVMYTVQPNKLLCRSLFVF